MYVEIWGIVSAKYSARRDRKREGYRDHGLTLIELYPEDFAGDSSGMSSRLSSGLSITRT